MRNISNSLLWLTATLIWSLPFPAAASGDREFNDPIACYKANEPLNSVFRSHLLLQCFIIPADICLALDDTEECFKRLNNRLESFFKELYPQLPSEISNIGFVARRYKRDVERWQKSFINEEECKGEDGVDFLTCKYIRLSSETKLLISYARLAQIEVP